MSETVVVDCSSGEQTVRELTEDELAVREDDLVREQEREQVVAARESRRAAAITKLEQIAGAESLTNAQAQDAIKFQARVLAKALTFLDLDPDPVA